MDAIIDAADVAKMTLYRNFHSKQELAVAFLALREERWLKGWLQAETQARAASPAGRLLAIFDVFTEWFERDEFEGCPFIASLLEFEQRGDPVRQACVEHLAGIRGYVCELATAAGVLEPERFAAQWHILMKGAIVSAHEGDLDAAMKARELGLLLLEREGHRPPPAALAVERHQDDSAIESPRHGMIPSGSWLGREGLALSEPVEAAFAADVPDVT